jgi:hypothetical protein
VATIAFLDPLRRAPVKQIVADDVILHSTLARLLRPPPTTEGAADDGTAAGLKLVHISAQP